MNGVKLQNQKPFGFLQMKINKQMYILLRKFHIKRIYVLTIKLVLSEQIAR